MPDLNENLATWNAASSWTARGDEWSGPWGGSDPQWWGTLLPRVHTFLPAQTVLELGPGHGRWTHYLKDRAQELIVVDLAESCISACRERFASAENIAFHVNDGRSLPMVESRSVDFAFSFDSLVHAEADVLQAYLQELSRTLKPDGVGFIHHSNMGALRRHAKRAGVVPQRLRPTLIKRGMIVNLHAWRAVTPTATAVARACEPNGLACIGQELIAWEYGRFLTDTISLVTPLGSCWERANVVVENPCFIAEARRLARTECLYGRSSFSSSPQR